MAWDDRDYYRDEQRAGPMNRLGAQSVVTWLMVLNVVVFVIDSIFTGSARAGALSLSRWGNFNIDDAVHSLQLWRWFTYQFIHADLLHLLFNMIGLYFFGPLMEQWWQARRFLAFYLLCGACGAVVFTILAWIPGVLPGGTGGYVVGASGSLFGILAACAVLFPTQRVQLLFPPIPMSMRTLALVFLGISALSLIAGSRNAGGEAAHLGGAALAVLLVTRPGLLRWAEGIKLPRRDGAASARSRTSKQRQADARQDAEVDRILDKVRAHGLHSLTKAEQRTLQRETSRQRRVG